MTTMDSIEKAYVVGIDIGGQSTKMGIVNPRGEIVSQTVFDTKEVVALEVYLSLLRGGLEKLFACPEIEGKLERIKGIGIGAPNGNYYNGTIQQAPNLKWAKDEKGNPSTVYLKKEVEAMFGIPVAVTNDANAAAQGEMTYGVAKGMKHFIMITLGTGVGSGIVIDGKVLYGHDGFAGELGHTTAVRTNGRLCGCGRVGCLEAYTSAIGVSRTVREMLETTDTPSLLRELPLDTISSKDVFMAAEEGDELAKQVFNFTGKILGRAFADFIAFSSPEAIIIFGGLGKARKYIHQSIVDNMNANLLDLWKNKVKIEYSILKDSDAAILGASSLAWEV